MRGGELLCDRVGPPENKFDLFIVSSFVNTAQWRVKLCWQKDFKWILAFLPDSSWNWSLLPYIHLITPGTSTPICQKSGTLVYVSTNHRNIPSSMCKPLFIQHCHCLTRTADTPSVLFFLSSPAETSLYSFHYTQFACLKSRCYTSESSSSR